MSGGQVRIAIPATVVEDGGWAITQEDSGNDVQVIAASYRRRRVPKTLYSINAGGADDRYEVVHGRTIPTTKANS